MDKIVSLKNVKYTYTPDNPDSRYAVNDVSIEVAEGEWLAIVGHNGSGKSTIARLMNGLLFPQEGSVQLFGLPMNEENIWEIRSQLGMVFQNPDNQFVGATVQDDVAFALENNSVPYEEMVQKVTESLKLVKMEQFMDHEPHHLSGGQKQRVAIAGALALHPKLLILDEATSMLDPLGREEVLKTVQDLRNSTGLTVISITHDLEEAISADRIIVMNDGQKYAEGIPREIFSSGNKLTELGLDLPFSLKMTQLLRQEGMNLIGEHMTEEELVNEIWTSHFSN